MASVGAQDSGSGASLLPEESVEKHKYKSFK